MGWERLRAGQTERLVDVVEKQEKGAAPGVNLPSVPIEADAGDPPAEILLAVLEGLVEGREIDHGYPSHILKQALVRLGGLQTNAIFETADPKHFRGRSWTSPGREQRTSRLTEKVVAGCVSASSYFHHQLGFLEHKRDPKEMAGRSLFRWVVNERRARPG